MPGELLHGIHSVREALLAGRRQIQEIRIVRHRPSPRLEALERLAMSKNVPVRWESVAITAGFKGDPPDGHQGVTANVSAYPTSDVFDVLKAPRIPETPPFLLLLDGIVDPQNLGALIRTALCAGVDGVFMPKDRSASPSPTVSRASAGAMEHMRVGLVTNLSETVRTVKQHGLWVAGLDAAGGQSLFDTDFTPGIALVVGGEGKGIRPLVKRSCDFLVSLPQVGPVASLNASAAGAVAMYEVFRQRLAISKGTCRVHP